MPRYKIEPTIGGFSCEAGSVTAEEDGTFVIENGSILSAMAGHGLRLTEIPAEPDPAAPETPVTEPDAKAPEPALAPAAKQPTAKQPAKSGGAKAAAPAPTVEATEPASSSALDAVLDTVLGGENAQG